MSSKGGESRRNSQEAVAVGPGKEAGGLSYDYDRSRASRQPKDLFGCWKEQKGVRKSWLRG